MERTITITTPDGKTTTHTSKVRDIAYLDMCRLNHATVTKNKKKYNRKQKYKKDYAEY